MVEIADVVFAIAINGDDYENYSNLFRLSEHGLVIHQKTIEPPPVKSVKVEVPGRNGDVDLTNAFYGNLPRYSNRKIILEIASPDEFRNDGKKWNDIFSLVYGKLHGFKVAVFFDEEARWIYNESIHLWEPAEGSRYYEGRASVTDATIGVKREALTIEIDCFPFKTELYGNSISYSAADGRRKEYDITSTHSAVTYLEELDCEDTLAGCSITIDNYTFDYHESIHLDAGYYSKVPEVMIFPNSKTTIGISGQGSVSARYMWRDL